MQDMYRFTVEVEPEMGEFREMFDRIKASNDGRRIDKIVCEYRELDGDKWVQVTVFYS